MDIFYFTFGTSELYPFQGGWVVVFAPDKHMAIEAFQKVYPNRPGSEFYNAADCYSSKEFEGTSMYHNGNLGYRCHDVIIFDDIKA